MDWRDPYESGWMRVLRFLSRSFRLGHFFGVEVRVYWVALVVMPLLAMLELGRAGLPTLDLLAAAALFTLWLYVLVWSHEMGHIVAARRSGIRTPLITLSPLGGLAHLSTPVFSPRVDILVSLAGPATHLLWLAVVWPLSLVFDEGRGPGFDLLGFSLDFLRQANLWLMLFNLLPFLPMDGGRVLRAALGMKLHPNRATLIAARVGQVGAVAFVIYGFTQRDAWATILVAIGITNFLACRREVRAARHGPGPWAGDRPDPWAFDPDAWKRGADATGAARPGFWGRRRAERERRARERDAQEADRLAADLDRVLDRVSQVGMAGLTRQERRILERASKARRR